MNKKKLRKYILTSRELELKKGGPTGYKQIVLSSVARGYIPNFEEIK